MHHQDKLCVSYTIAFTMSAIAGFSDVFGFIALKQLFTAHITGNIVMIISYAISHTPGITSRIFAIPVFIIIAIIASLLIEAHGIVKSMFRVWILIEALLFLALMASGICLKSAIAKESTTFVLVSMLPVTAMAIHNTLMKTYLVKLPPATVMTGNLTQLVVDSAAICLNIKQRRLDKNSARTDRIKKYSWIILGFIIGGGISLCFLWFQFYAILLLIPFFATAIICA